MQFAILTDTEQRTNFKWFFKNSQDKPLGLAGNSKENADFNATLYQQGSPGDRVSIIFTLKNQVGNLARALQVFQELGINVLHLELSPLENATNQVLIL